MLPGPASLANLTTYHWPACHEALATRSFFPFLHCPTSAHPRASSGSVPSGTRFFPLGQESASLFFSTQLKCHFFQEGMCRPQSTLGPVSHSHCKMHVFLALTIMDVMICLLSVFPVLKLHKGGACFLLSSLLNTWVRSWSCFGDHKQFTR